MDALNYCPRKGLFCMSLTQKPLSLLLSVDFLRIFPVSCSIFLPYSEARNTEVVGDIVDDEVDEMTIGGERNEQIRINNKSSALRRVLQDRLPSLLVSPSMRQPRVAKRIHTRSPTTPRWHPGT